MSAEQNSELQLEIGHLLLIDVVGYSTLLVNEQIEFLQQLNKIVRGTERFRAAEAAGKLVRLPTGDGMALIFFRSPEEPAQCALEISQALKSVPAIKVRMGVHSGPVNQVQDVNDRSNIAGAGINVAQRVMDCGDAGHILLSKHVADDLAQYRHWRPYLHDLGECEVKHGLRLHIANLCKEDLGNPRPPEKLTRRHRWQQKSQPNIRPILAPRWPKLGLFAALALSMAALGVSIFVVLHRSLSPLPPAGQGSAVPPVSDKSIAVLPFQNLADDKQNSYLAEGIQDEILTDLAKVADLKVISRTSVMQYTGAERNVRDIAKELGVAHILEGTVQGSGGRVRINVQLINARTDTHVWAEHYDGELADVFALQSALSEKIVEQLKAKLSPAEKAAIDEQPTRDLAAYNLYEHAKSILSSAIFNFREKEKLFEAANLLQDAVGRDPNFFLAYYQLARTHDRLYILGIDHSDARLALAEAAVATALRLRPDSAEAHLARAAHVYSAKRDYDRAREELAIAGLKLPNEPLVFELLGYIDRRQGRWTEAVRNLKRASEVDPRNFFILQQIALACEHMRQFDEAARAMDRVLLLIPKDAGSRVERALIELDARADAKPLQAAIRSVVSEDPNAAGGIAENWLFLGLCQRDWGSTASALDAMTGDGCRMEGVPFPRSWCEAVAARARGDGETMRATLGRARVEIERIVREQPDYAEALCVLGLIDAGLGHREEAIREGKRAVELLPLPKDSINGALLIEYLALIYAWSGDNDHAIEQLTKASSVPCDVNYGLLKLHPNWDALRRDPRFENLVASLAPK